MNLAAFILTVHVCTSHLCYRGAKEEEVSVEPAMSRDSFEYMEQFGDDDFQTSGRAGKGILHNVIRT